MTLGDFLKARREEKEKFIRVLRDNLLDDDII